MPRLRLSAGDDETDAFVGPIAQACTRLGLEVAFAGPGEPPESIDYVVLSPAGPVRDFGPYIGMKAALSLWAGVEGIVGNPTLTAPLCRLVDPGLTEGMVDYVTGHVLRHHLGLDALLAAQDGVWRGDAAAPLARERTVGMLGLGALGRACALALAELNFDVLGWSRRPAEIPGIACHAGQEGLARVLGRAEILVTLLPATPDTERLLDAARLSEARRGVVLINPGRGTLIDDDALLAALDSGQVAHATLDVFREEPLPPDHPFWAHRGVTVTPHIAAVTRPETAAEAIAENIRRGEAGLPFLNVVDRQAGY